MSAGPAESWATPDNNYTRLGATTKFIMVLKGLGVGDCISGPRVRTPTTWLVSEEIENAVFEHSLALLLPTVACEWSRS
jgi:hypothetical protein